MTNNEGKSEKGTFSIDLAEINSEMKSMDHALKVHVQLLLDRNLLSLKKIMYQLSIDIDQLLKERGKEVDKNELQMLLVTFLQPFLEMENERLFHAEFNLIESTNEIVADQVYDLLREEETSACFKQLDQLISHLLVGIEKVKRVLPMELTESLVYELTIHYQLHSDIKLYLDIKRLMEEYKEKFRKLFMESLTSLQVENIDRIRHLKDNLMVRLDQQKERIITG